MRRRLFFEFIITGSVDALRLIRRSTLVRVYASYIVGISYPEFPTILGHIRGIRLESKNRYPRQL